MPPHPPWDDRQPPRSEGLTVYRPVRPEHPATPGGQVARDRGGTWYYRPGPTAPPDTTTVLPAFLPPDLDHFLRRRGQLLTAIDHTHDRARCSALLDAYNVLGTSEVRAVEDALEHADQVWHQIAPGPPPHVWIVAPRKLAFAAERLRPAGTRRPTT